MELSDELATKINKYLALVEQTGLNTNEAELLADIVSKPTIKYVGDCLALYLICLTLRWRGSCQELSASKLQVLSDCSNCNLNVEKLINNKPEKIYFAGFQINNKYDD